MEQIMDFLTPAIINLFGAVVTVAFGFLSYKITKWGNEFVNTKSILMTAEEKKAVINTTVEYVEQVFKDLHGADKLNKAKEKALSILAEEGINISDEQLEILIEAAVKGMNGGKIEVNKEA